jgi:serine/threonine protein kinase
MHCIIGQGQFGSIRQKSWHCNNGQYITVAEKVVDIFNPWTTVEEKEKLFGIIKELLNKFATSHPRIPKNKQPQLNKHEVLMHFFCAMFREESYEDQNGTWWDCTSLQLENNTLSELYYYSVHEEENFTSRVIPKLLSVCLQSHSYYSLALHLPLYEMDLEKYIYQNHINQNKNIQQDFIRKVFEQISSGLYALNDTDRVHLHVKPANIAVFHGPGNVSDIRLVLIDGGNCNTTGTVIQRDGPVVTPFQPPEGVYMQKCALGIDLWSLGVILLQMCGLIKMPKKFRDQYPHLTDEQYTQCLKYFPRCTTLLLNGYPTPVGSKKQHKRVNYEDIYCDSMRWGAQRIGCFAYPHWGKISKHTRVYAFAHGQDLYSTAVRFFLTTWLESIVDLSVAWNACKAFILPLLHPIRADRVSVGITTRSSKVASKKRWCFHSSRSCKSICKRIGRSITYRNDVAVARTSSQ